VSAFPAKPIGHRRGLGVARYADDDAHDPIVAEPIAARGVAL
jgi:hypothetical protein